MRREASLLILGVSICKFIRFISHTRNGNPPVAVNESFEEDVISTETVSPPVSKYDVFLSFRGEDTRDTFSSFLYEALCNAGIETFMDHKLRKGDNISPILLKTIEESDISLIIFSKDYASSTWCMDELVHVMKCKDQYKRIVIPIFYDVDPSNVRKQNGSFGDGFAKLKKKFMHDQRRVQEWIDSLIQSANLSGFHSKNFRPEPELIKKIVKDISSKLGNKSSFHKEGLVGIDHQIQKIEELLSVAPIVGIWGMGGIGKTTLAEAVFDSLKARFEAVSFVGNVRERLGKFGFDELVGKCLKELLNDEGLNAYHLRSTFVERRLRGKKILMVLDDVDDSIAVEDLIKACRRCSKESRIIITSRDLQVLKNASKYATYHQVQKLKFSHGLCLFSLEAFKQKEPSKSFLGLSERVVHYCEGNPLALKVLGCLLHGRGIEVWKNALKKLNQSLDQGIFNVLKLSFDGLDDMQKKLFIELAFLLKHKISMTSLDLARHVFVSYEHFDIDMSVLKDRALISLRENGDIEMHALLIDMGLEMSRHEKPIRVLWRHENIYHLFDNEEGIEATRFLSLDKSKMKRVTVKAKHFQKMHNLIFLEVYNSDCKKSAMLNICGDLDYFPEELRFFIWEEYPLSYVPLHFCAENLVELTMYKSNIRQFGHENQHFPNLKTIALQKSKDLTALPDLSYAPKVEYLLLTGCANLSQIHSSTFMGKLKQLVVSNGPKRINIGGNIEGARSGVVMGFKYLDFEDLSIHEVRMKVLVCKNMICGFRFTHVVTQLEERAELRKGTQSLTSLLPFISRVDCFKCPIEFGHHSNQHDIYTCYCGDLGDYYLSVSVEVEKGEWGVVGALRRQMINEEEGRCGSKNISLMADDEEEEEDEELMIKEYRGSNSNAILFTTLPKSIARWSLLKKLRLRESDMNENEGCSFLTSLIELSHHHHHHPTTTIQPVCFLDFKLSFPGISALRDDVPSMRVFYASKSKSDWYTTVYHYLRIWRSQEGNLNWNCCDACRY